MPDLHTELGVCLRERVCFVGLGNVDRGDDGVGMRLAEALQDGMGGKKVEQGKGGVRNRGAYHVVMAGTALERWGSSLARQECRHIVFLDAVDFGGAPGSVVWLDAGEIRARYPQVSTHGLSLGAWAQWLELGGDRKVSLLGIQPNLLCAGPRLSAPVAATVSLLVELVGRN